MDPGLVAAGLGVGILVGLTGMGAGSLMTPILITMFGIPASTAVGTDLVYAAITKAFGAARHHQLKNVNKELALWMATGSVPAAFLGTFMLYNVFGNINAWLPDVIGFTLVLVGIAVAIRTFVTIRGLWDATQAARRTARSRPRHKTYAVIIGVVFGFILGLTSVGSGVFFGMTLVTLFPLSARRVVGTDLLHAFLVTMAAGLGTILFGVPNYAYVGDDPGRLDPGHPDRLALHAPAARAGAARLHRRRARALRHEAPGRLLEPHGSPWAATYNRRPWAEPGSPPSSSACSSPPRRWRSCARST